MEDLKHDDIIDNPDAAVNMPEWTDQSVEMSVVTSGPNKGDLTEAAAVQHAQLTHELGEVAADHFEFSETIKFAAGNVDVAYFANPEISEEEAIRRLIWARERASVAVEQAKAVQRAGKFQREHTSESQEDGTILIKSNDGSPVDLDLFKSILQDFANENNFGFSDSQPETPPQPPAPTNVNS